MGVRNLIIGGNPFKIAFFALPKSMMILCHEPKNKINSPSACIPPSSKKDKKENYTYHRMVTNAHSLHIWTRIIRKTCYLPIL